MDKYRFSQVHCTEIQKGRPGPTPSQKRRPKRSALYTLYQKIKASQGFALTKARVHRQPYLLTCAKQGQMLTPHQSRIQAWVYVPTVRVFDIHDKSGM
jgi:hypothetical protein